MPADRARLAALQKSLLEALLDGKPAPPRFDAERLRVAAATLISTRERSRAKRGSGG